ncbi:20140_t:CDS:2, partial [Gigaspora rosea]
EFCSNWFYGQAMGEKKLRTYFRVICESTDIQFGGRNLSNYSERKTAVQVLKELGYSDAVVMSIMRHKSQKGLASYEQQKSTMQQEASSLFKRGSSIVSLAGHINMLEVDDYEPPGTTSDYDEPPEANTNKPPEASTNDTPGATTSDAAGATCTYKPLQPQIRNVL